MNAIVFGPSVVFASIKKGAPYQAELEATVSVKQPNGETVRHSMTGRVYRDSDGRTRREMVLEAENGKAPRLTYICNPPIKMTYVLDDSNKTFIEQSDEFGHGRSETEPTIPAEDHTAELPIKQIEGLVCYGYHTTRSQGDALEFWFSLELGEVLLEKSVSASVERLLRIFNIRRSEPDASLFAVPPDYGPASPR